VLRSGEGGIRTLDGGIHPHNALAGRRLQPLGHFSARARRIAEWLTGVLAAEPATVSAPEHERQEHRDADTCVDPPHREAPSLLSTYGEKGSCLVDALRAVGAGTAEHDLVLVDRVAQPICNPVDDALEP
jgi:hypothetical protein